MAVIASLNMRVNTATPVTAGQPKRLITLNSFSKFSSVTTTDRAGITKHVCIHNADFDDKMLVHTFLLPRDIFCGICIYLLLRGL